jgi:hypothetical protein
MRRVPTSNDAWPNSIEHKSRKTHHRNRPSKTRVFERTRQNGKVRGKGGLMLSQNSFLISTSQKVRVRLSFGRVHDDQTEKDCLHGRTSKAATSAGRAEGGASAIIRCRRHHVETDADRLCPRVDRRPEPCLALQRDALTEAGCAKIFTEQMSGAVTDRPALHDALEFARSGDTLIVWKLDRLARSMKQLIETIENLRVRGIGFRSLTEALDTTTAQGRWFASGGIARLQI